MPATTRAARPFTLILVARSRAWVSSSSVAKDTVKPSLLESAAGAGAGTGTRDFVVSAVAGVFTAAVSLSAFDSAGCSPTVARRRNPVQTNGYQKSDAPPVAR